MISIHTHCRYFFPLALLYLWNTQPLQAWVKSPSILEDWQFGWPRAFISAPLSRFLLTPLVHAAVWLVLPWHRAARKRLHMQHLVFSSQRAANKRLRASDAKHTLHESSCVDWRSGFCSFNSRGFTFPCQHSAEGLLQTRTNWVTIRFTEEFFSFFFSSQSLGAKRNHFFGNETGIFPHIMHFNGYRWLSG